jgi:hypothetical protein
MANMVAARFVAGFEFFAQHRQKSLATATLVTSHSGKSGHKTGTHKKARPDFSGAGCEVQGKLEVLEKLTVVSSFAV